MRPVVRSPSSGASGLNRAASIGRFVLRAASLLVLAVAIWLAVLDAARSIATQRWTSTPLREDWTAVWPEGAAGFEAWAATLPPDLRDAIVLSSRDFPGWAALAALAAVLGLAGHKPEAREIPRSGGGAA